jgi:mRNA interferase MazF
MPTREFVAERGEVWVERPPRDLVGHEQRGQRPVVVISGDAINAGPWPIVVVVPLTTRDRGMSLHVELEPPDGGVRTRSFALVEQIHAVDRTLLVERWGRISSLTMREVEDRLRIVLQLG